MNSENQSGFSSSIVLTYIRIASIAAVSPSCVQLLHLALSMAFQPQGLGARHGPAVACWYSAYSRSRVSSATARAPRGGFAAKPTAA